MDYKKEKERSIYLLSFLLPLILMVAMMISKKVFPFGDRCILRTDFYHQYLPFHVELQHKLKEFKSLFYTFSVGLGNNFLTLLAYYLVCPFNLFLLLVPNEFTLEFLTLMIVIKIALSGLSMSFYLTKRYDTDSFIVIMFSMFYALSGYVAAYYWDIMWLDNVVIFPILVYAFEKMFNGGKPFLYIITLAMTILCNYYIGTITCIFLFIYFFFYSILKEVKIKQFFINLVKMGAFSIIGVMISAVLLIPIFYAFNTTASGDISFPKSAREYFSIIDVISRQLPFVKVENGIDYWPNIYSGTFCFAGVVLYFLSKKYKLKEKICYAILLLFFIASFSINVLDFVWHVCKYPNSLPCRQSFIYTFILLSVCIKPMLKLKSLKIKDLSIAFAIPILFLVLFEKSLINEKNGFYSVYMAIILLFVYFILLLCYQSKKIDKNVVLYFAIVVVCFEAFINMYQTSITTIKKDDYIKNTKIISSMADGIKKINDDIYRVERAVMKTKNDGAYIHFPSASIFSSSTYEDGTSFYKSMGMEASTNAYSTTGSTPFADSLLSIKYKIYESEEKNASLINKTLIANEESVYMYENLDTLPFTYVLSDDFIENYDKSSGNPATVQNNFSRTLKTGILLDKQTIVIDGANAKFKAEESGDYYVFVRDKGIQEVTVIYPTTTKNFKNLNRGYFIELGFIKEGTELEFRNETNDDDLLIEVFKFNFDTLKDTVNNINSNFEYDMIKFDETNINFKMNSIIDGSCVVTLPFDKGFKILVDGNVVESKQMLDFFLGFDIKKGEHIVELIYTPKGFYLGLYVSIAGALLLITLYIIDKKNIKLK